MSDTQEENFNSPVQVKVSRLAITAIGMSIISTCMLIFCDYLDSHYKLVNNFLFEAFSCILVIAIILGIVSSIRIEASGGKITGEKLSVAAVLLPIFAVFLTTFFTVLQSERKRAYGLVCGSNLSNIGKHMLIYSNDYDDVLFRSGGKESAWTGKIANWKAETFNEAFGLNSDSSGGTVSISSSLYLLVKYTNLEPELLVCPTDRNVGTFSPSQYGAADKDLINYWDFGPRPWRHNSYSLQMPYGKNPLKWSNKPGTVIMADRNPWIPSLGWDVKNFTTFNPDSDKDSVNNGNTPCHKYEGQNVLYLDTHVNFDSVSFSGIDEDNIYTSWNGSDIRKGTPPKVGNQPADKLDSLLVNDPPVTKP